MSAHVPTHFYVYYRLRPELDADVACASVRAMQAMLARRTGVAGRLMQRAGDDATWMEVYEGVTDPAGFEHALLAETEAHRLGDLLDTGGARHLERFTEVV